MQINAGDDLAILRVMVVSYKSSLLFKGKRILLRCDAMHYSFAYTLQRAYKSIYRECPGTCLPSIMLL